MYVGDMKLHVSVKTMNKSKTSSFTMNIHYRVIISGRIAINNSCALQNGIRLVGPLDTSNK